MRTPFLHAVFRGTRFQRPALPVDVLRDLAEYRELLLAVAKELYFQRNPDRQRVPKGFADRFDLALTGIGEGSTVAELARGDERMLPGVQEMDIYSDARSLIGDAIHAANDKRRIPEEFPGHLIPMFNKFGRRLDGGESIELRPPGAEHPGPIYSVDTRKALMLLVNQELEASFLGYGRVTGVEVKPRKIWKLELASGAVVQAPLTEAVQSTVFTAFAEYRMTWLRIRGTAHYDRNDRVTDMTEIEDVSVVEDPQSKEFDSVIARLCALERLGAGWLDGEGVALRGLDIGWVKGALLLLLGETDLPRPGIYPTPEGMVQAEVSNDDLDLTLVFSPTEGTVRVEICRFDDGAELEESFERGHIEALAGFVRPYAQELNPAAGARDA